MKKYLSRLTALLLALALLAAPAYALTVDEALELLEETYYYGVPEEAYEAETLDELFDILGDPYTTYMTEEEYRAFLGSMEDEVTNTVGIGVTIQYTDQGILVVDVLSGGSALDGGLLSGDLIVEINGTPCVPAGEEHRTLLTGEEGSSVTLTILRDGEEREFTLTRRPVVIRNIQIQVLEGRVGYIDCNGFGVETGEEMAGILKEYESQVDRWILDLRGNPGGYTNAAVDMLNALCGPGYYLYLQEGSGAVAAVPGAQLLASAKPVMLLTDGDSASSSEIVAGGIRDGGRGLLIGSRTFGKGVAQTMLDEKTHPEYFDGDGIKVTDYRFYTAGFNTPDRMGVIPTLLVDDAHTGAVALALCGSETDARLSISLDGSACFVDPGTDGDTLKALFEALPPQARVYYRDKGAFDEVSVAEAAEKLGVDYENRWFSDVADGPYARAINIMGAYKLLNGTGGGKFSPDGKLTRAQLCVMLARVLNLGGSDAGQFSDVPQDAWYAGAVNAVAALGLVEGTGGGKFSPDGTLTQEQFMTIMGRVARFANVTMEAYGQWVEENPGQLDLSQRMALNPYSDWARTSVAVLAWGVEDGLKGDGDMLFAPMDELDPKQAILRGEAAAGMYAVLSGLGILP